MDEQQPIHSSYYNTNRLARQSFETLEGYHKRLAMEKKMIKMHKYGQLIKAPKDQKWYKIQKNQIQKDTNADAS